jgi:hypothetical protein
MSENSKEDIASDYNGPQSGYKDSFSDYLLKQFDKSYNDYRKSIDLYNERLLKQAVAFRWASILFVGSLGISTLDILVRWYGY